MSQQHRVIISNGGVFNLNANPLVIQANASIGMNIVATGYGRAIGGSGTRIWDTNVLAANYSATMAAGATITLPLSTANLPSYFFDALMFCRVNGALLIPIAISNSPDNAGVYSASQPPSAKILYWTDLLCYGQGTSRGDSNTANNYMFGGNSGIPTYSQGFNVYFSEPLPSPLSMTFNRQFISYDNGVESTVTGVATIPIGSTSYTFASYYAYDYLGNRGLTGYLKIKIETADTNYRSLLPVFHHGIS